MITLIPIEPLNEQHGALIVEAFSRLLIDGGGQPDGGVQPGPDGWGYGYGHGYGDGNGWGYGDGDGNGYGGVKIPDEWRVE